MINAYLYLDDKKYRLLNLYFNFNQNLGTNNRPSGLPRGGQLNVTLPANDKDLTMLDWTINNNQQKKGRIEIMSRDGGSIGFKMEFANAYATSASYIYDSNSSEPMNYSITITAGILRINGDNTTIHKQTWDDGTAFNEHAPITVIDDEPLITNHFIEDLEGNQIDKSEIDIGEEINLIVESNNAVGELFELDLDDSKLDYEHNGIKLENDILEVVINNDIMSIPLKAIKQEN